MKKGYTLIELLGAAAIAGTLIVLITTMFLKYNDIYKSNIKENRNYFYCTEALMFIENEVGDCKSTAISSNKIVMNYNDETVKKRIQLNNDGSLVIVYVENNLTEAVNNILNNVQDFEVIQKGNTIYVSIQINNGEKYERCFGINAET